jgi:uncharacterized membrane protein (UPF0136 family)
MFNAFQGIFALSLSSGQMGYIRQNSRVFCLVGCFVCQLIKKSGQYSNTYETSDVVVLSKVVLALQYNILLKRLLP